MAPGPYMCQLNTDPMKSRMGILQVILYRTECDVPVPGIFIFFGGIGTGIGKIWYRKKVPVSVSEKFVTGKSIGTGTGKKLI